MSRRWRSVLVLAAMAGCGRIGFAPAEATSDADTDADTDAVVDAAPSFEPRLIATAHFSDADTSAGMTNAAYSIATDGIVDGDLVLFAMNIDNGPVIPAPTTHFTELVQRTFGRDGQTYAVFAAIADHEPAVYTGSYGGGATSGAAALALVAIRGADPAAVVTRFDEDTPCSLDPCGSNPVVDRSSGIDTTVPGSIVLYLAGADWLNQDAGIDFATPPGLTTLAAFGDRNKIQFWWTSMMLAYTVQAQPGSTGQLVGTMTNTDDTFTGMAWTVTLAIPPGP